MHELHKEDFGGRMGQRGDTVLHIAVQAKRIHFVEELLKVMNKEDVAQKKMGGRTALHDAAASGRVDLAKLIIDKNPDIASDRDLDDYFPIDVATVLGHKDMVKYLYPKTKSSLDEQDRIELLLRMINSDLYDNALQLFIEHPELATTRVSWSGDTALHALSRKHLPPPNQNSAGFFKKFFGFVALVEFIWKKAVLLDDSKIEDLIARPWPLISEVVKRGNVEFLSILIREYPALICYRDKNSYNIFHLAVLNRQEDIFKLIYETGSIMDVLTSEKDREDNNILHLAGMMAPKNRLDIVPGAALQMQYELLWFQAVDKVVQPVCHEAKNKEGLTPRELFAKSHESLREEGEKWLKDTASSCMVVATIIATIAFATAFTAPGGTKGDKGLPFFLENVFYKIFAISDAISLVSSSTSILYFLSILTSRHAQEDFLVASPSMLNVARFILFISIAAMMVMFSMTFFLAFKDGRLWIAILVAIIASSPVLVFTRQHYQLFREFLTMTYGSPSLLKPGRRYLFYKPEDKSEQLTIQCLG